MKKIKESIKFISNLSALVLMFVGLLVGTIMSVFSMFYMIGFRSINPLVDYPLLWWYGSICWFVFFGILIYPGVKEDYLERKRNKTIQS